MMVMDFLNIKFYPETVTEPENQKALFTFDKSFDKNVPVDIAKSEKVVKSEFRSGKVIIYSCISLLNKKSYQN